MSSLPEQDQQLSFWKRVWTQFRAWLQLNLWPVLGLVAVTFLVYAPVVNFGFLNWDDTWYIVQNDLIKSWNPVNLYKIATEPVARNFAPLTIGTFLVEHTLWGLWPGGYHLTNVLLHAVNAVLVYSLVERISKNQLAAWGLAALFALHPLQVETVAWISSRKTLLSTTFMLAGLICWLRVERTSRHEGWGIIWLLLGLLSKASVVVVPPIVVAWDVLIGKKKFADSAAKQIIPMFFCVMLIFITMSAQTTIVGGVRSHIGASKLWIFAIDCTVLWRYVGMMFVPNDLCVLYDPETSGIAGWIALSVVSWIGLAGLAWKFHKRYSMTVFCFVSWILLLIPVLNLFPITTLMNDRYLYLPMVPFFCGVLLGAKEIWKSFQLPQLSKRFAMAPLLSCVAIVSVYCWGTLTYLPVWSQPLTLWHYAKSETPTLTVVQIQWALTLQDLGETDDAREALKYALAHCNPDELDQKRIQRMLDEWDHGTQGDEET
ncbi:hypothetical protein [Thalassoglobus polymorphus]|uniref:Tetratricopeptide repeat protein n=1 Tax=Thalassoglobus polymorphus TaxID=2527994 RepID=A0A517QS36_9PLAN|nr:hypothetical protein [Thalassoglobus polymorphus]QDT34446.1 hypothetical protein Mal48_37060 [Thalassoglobus polymorphus]